MSKLTTIFSEEIFDIVAVMETSAAEFSVTVVCDDDKVTDGGLEITDEEPPPHPDKTKRKYTIKILEIVLINSSN